MSRMIPNPDALAAMLALIDRGSRFDFDPLEAVEAYRATGGLVLIHDALAAVGAFDAITRVGINEPSRA